jgi:hypothetical protein
MSRGFVPDPGIFLDESGLLFEINLVVLHRHGLSAELGVDGSIGLVDHREHEGGVVFTAEEIRQNRDRFLDLQAKNVPRIEARRRMLGDVRQTLFVPRGAE